MTKQELRIKLNSLKHGDQTSINGYDIKKLGTLWVVKKGDHIKKSFDASSIDSAVVKILGENQLAPITKKEKKAIQLKVKKELKIQKKTEKLLVREAKLYDKKGVKQVVQIINQIKPEPQKKELKRNKVTLEGLDVFTQAVAYLTWFLYFFTEQLHTLLGNYDIFAAVGVGVLALLVHYVYSAQLGLTHRAVNILVGLIYIALVGAALVFYYGPLSHRAFDLNEVLPSLELAMQEPQSLSILSFMLVKWILLFFANKK